MDEIEGDVLNILPQVSQVQLNGSTIGTYDLMNDPDLLWVVSSVPRSAVPEWTIGLASYDRD